MKFLQIFLLTAVTCVALGKSLQSKTDDSIAADGNKTLDIPAKISKDVLRKVPKKFEPSADAKLDEEPIFIMEVVLPASAFEEIVPEEAVLEETAPVETAPEETAPVETAPEETAPVETAPEETAPVETAPEETAPVETLPEETAPEDATKEIFPFLRPIFREDIPVETFRRSHGPGLTSRQRIEQQRNFEDAEEAKRLFHLAQESLLSMSGETGQLGLTRHEEGLLSSFKPLDF